MTRLAAAFGAILVMQLMWLAPPSLLAQTQPDSCVSCHATLPEARLSSPVAAFRGDVHDQRGFHCVDCHGGDPTAADKSRAKDPAKGYRGKPAGTQIIAACARCHSDAAFMRKYAPRQRVDQAAEYATSVHGKRLATGDQRVATCATCHHAHGIRQVNDARSSVFPTNIATLCGSCHADPDHMKGYTVAGGTPIPTTQRDEYQKSVHYTALAKKNDLSAPTCNDCHGNHGAAPPGIEAVSNVCGTCHTVFATNFAESAHSQIFERACVECHSNHAVLPTSDALIGTTKEALCSECHTEKDDPGFVAAGRMRASIERLKTSLDASSELIARVRNAGMEVSDQELALGELRTKLTQARTEIHRFDPAALDRVVEEGMKGLSSVERAGNQALADLNYRRRGLFVSFAAIMLVVIGLVLKIRELDRRHKA